MSSVLPLLNLNCVFYDCSYLGTDFVTMCRKMCPNMNTWCAPFFQLSRSFSLISVDTFSHQLLIAVILKPNLAQSEPPASGIIQICRNSNRNFLKNKMCLHPITTVFTDPRNCRWVGRMSVVSLAIMFRIE